jgi:LysR family transcriptional regulator for bpeEF and oprC
MDRFESMRIFAKVVELNSFTRAADSLGLQRSTVSVMVQKLEAHLQIRLLQRTTRRLNITPEGRDYHQHCLRILMQLDETQDMLTSTGNGLRGRLRVQMPTAIGRLVVLPHIGRFRERYPDVNLVIGLNDRLDHWMDDDLDCSIQTGVPESMDAVQRKVGESSTMTAASPAYLQRYGTPLCIDDLGRHVAVHCLPASTGNGLGFRFEIDGAPVEVDVKVALATSDMEACALCSANGAGLIQAPRLVLAPYLESGVLEEVLAPWRPRSQPVVAVFPGSRQVTLKSRMFVDWIAELFEGCPSMRKPLPDRTRANTVTARSTTCAPGEVSTQTDRGR